MNKINLTRTRDRLGKGGHEQELGPDGQIIWPILRKQKLPKSKYKQALKNPKTYNFPNETKFCQIRSHSFGQTPGKLLVPGEEIWQNRREGD